MIVLCAQSQLQADIVQCIKSAVEELDCPSGSIPVLTWTHNIVHI